MGRKDRNCLSLIWLNSSKLISSIAQLYYNFWNYLHLFEADWGLLSGFLSLKKKVYILKMMKCLKFRFSK